MIKFILILLSFVFTPFLFAQEKEVWSLEKPRSLGWSEVMYKCIDFQKQNKKTTSSRCTMEPTAKVNTSMSGCTHLLQT